MTEVLLLNRPEFAVTGRLRYALDIPRATPSNNEIKNLHFRQYQELRSTWALLLREALRTQGYSEPQVPLPQAFLHIERHATGSGLDWDNAYGGLKPLIDCLTLKQKLNPNGLGLIQNDNLKCMPYPPLLFQKKAPPGLSFTRIQIYELGEPNEPTP